MLIALKEDEPRVWNARGEHASTAYREGPVVASLDDQRRAGRVELDRAAGVGEGRIVVAEIAMIRGAVDTGETEEAIEEARRKMPRAA